MSESTTRDRGKALVLVVDDEQMMRLLARQALVRFGFTVVEAEDGEAALAEFERHDPDLVLLDVQMPRKDGFETCRQLRLSNSGRYTPVMMMTGLDDFDSIERAYEVGATDFINKPLNWLVLGHRLEYMRRSSRSAQSLRDSQAKLANAQRIAKLGYWEWIPDQDRLFCSGELRRIFDIPEGHQPTNLRELTLFVHDDQRREFRTAVQRLSEGRSVADLEYRVLTSERDERFVRQHAEAVFDDAGRVIRVSGTVQDVTEQRAAEEKVHYMAYYDGLTGLPNRRSFTENLERVLGDQRFRSESTAVLFVDLDRLNRVNESLGRNAGDELVRQAAVRIVGCVRATDLVARAQLKAPHHLVSRFDGDEFVLLLTQLTDLDATASVAQRLSETLSEPFDVDGQAIFVRASVGIGIFSHDGDDSEQLLRNAHLAAQHAKQSDGINCQFYTEAMNVAAKDRLVLEAELRTAIERNEFELHYQPQFDVSSGSIVGVEALLRWHHQEHGLISPGVFIPLAEELDLISELGGWVLRTACAQAGRWHAQQFDLRVAVNISNRQFADGDLVKTARAALDSARLQPKLLELELTESVILSANDNEMDQLEELRALGIRLAIDDFGTGYSSLSYLTRFPIDALKIDRSFIRDVPGPAQKEAIARAIIAMGQGLGLRVIAEGVETEEQLEFLRKFNCDEQQGFLMGKPMPAEQLSRLLASESPDRSASVSG